eukprot:4902693-Prorocentrum_lima.AAC.1
MSSPLFPSGTQGLPRRQKQKQRSRFSSGSDTSVSPASAGAAHAQPVVSPNFGLPTTSAS